MIATLLVALLAVSAPVADPVKDVNIIHEGNMRIVHSCPSGNRINTLMSEYFNALGAYRQAEAGNIDEEINGLLRACAKTTKDSFVKVAANLVAENDLENIERRCMYLLPDDGSNSGVAAYYACQAKELRTMSVKLETVRSFEKNKHVQYFAAALSHIDLDSAASMTLHCNEYLSAMKTKK